jgi:hypothetical protein
MRDIRRQTRIGAGRGRAGLVPGRRWPGLVTWLVGGLVGAWLLGLGLIGRPAAGEGQAAQSVVLAVPYRTVAPGARVTLPLTLAGEGVAVYSADIILGYDPSVVQAVSVARGELVSDWSMASNLGIPGEVRLALAGARPVSGSGELALITFAAAGGVGSASDVVFLRGELNEGAVSAALQNGRISVACYDLDGSGAVDGADLQMLAAHWREHPGNPGWDARFDLDGDGQVTVADIMRVAAAWGSTCE